MPNIKLKTCDEVIFDVDLQVAMVSNTVRDMLENLRALGEDDNNDANFDDDNPVPLQKLDSVMFKKVLEWATYHKDDPPVNEDEEDDDVIRRSDDIPEWDKNFLKVDQATLFKLITAANYLDIKGLFDVCCKTIANMIKGKSPEELRRTFIIRNNFSDEEKEEIRKLCSLRDEI
ncbi:S-phase kinase-associated protein 1-like [Lycorma delicatula]|uniref:S-phase kinase-associated protein 1-like n=1 Tax=Lycorma delicatula TaxID=130591 RepID=UPI003F510CA6